MCTALPAFFCSFVIGEGEGAGGRVEAGGGNIIQEILFQMKQKEVESKSNRMILECFKS